MFLAGLWFVLTKLRDLPSLDLFLCLLPFSLTALIDIRSVKDHTNIIKLEQTNSTVCWWLQRYGSLLKDTETWVGVSNQTRISKVRTCFRQACCCSASHLYSSWHLVRPRWSLELKFQRVGEQKTICNCYFSSLLHLYRQFSDNKLWEQLCCKKSLLFVMVLHHAVLS